MAEQPNRFPIDDDATDRLHSILQITQDLQRRIFRSVSRGFLTPAAVREMQYATAGIAKDVESLATIASLDPL